MRNNLFGIYFFFAGSSGVTEQAEVHLIYKKKSPVYPFFFLSLELETPFFENYSMFINHPSCDKLEEGKKKSTQNQTSFCAEKTIILSLKGLSYPVFITVFYC